MLTFLIIQSAMAKAFEVRVGDLATKLFAHTFVFGGFKDFARAIAVTLF